MNAAQWALLNQSERQLAELTTPEHLAELDEDEVADLHDRVRRARNKAVGQYRRGAARRVTAQGGRGAAAPKSSLARDKAEVWEQALARVSRLLGALASAAAADLKRERIEAARAARSSGPSTAVEATQPTSGRGTAARRASRTPASEKARASTKAAGARAQARKDAKSR